MRVAEEWKIGRKGQDNGALFLVAKNDRKMRIEVGYGLEGVLTDVTSRRIIAENVAPAFREGQFAAGINAGVDRIIAVVDEGKPLPPPKTDSRERRSAAAFDFDTLLLDPVRRRAGGRRHPARDLRPARRLDGRRRHRRRRRVARRRLAR